MFPDYFENKRVLDIGSLDINGHNSCYFDNCDFTGCDLGPGKGVDLVCPAHKLNLPPFDTIISTECFEHDPCLDRTLDKIESLLKPGGLFVFTCATTGRLEHGTHDRDSTSSPYTLFYYRNVDIQVVLWYLNMDMFEKYCFDVIPEDLRFWGVRKAI